MENNFAWDEATIKSVMKMRTDGATYKAIAEAVGTSETSVKHKVRRIQQADNQDRYKHTAEKAALFARTKPQAKRVYVLETHCGFGGMTEIYSGCYEVLSIDIDARRIAHVQGLGFENVETIKADSEREIFRLIGSGCRFEVVDVDGYGMPSRYFPHVFALIDDGVLYVTLPMIGVAQINKITIEHLRVFWGVCLADVDCYVGKVFARMQDYAFMHKREVELLEVVRLDRIYRLAIKVKKESLLKMVGLEVNRKKPANDNQKKISKIA